MLVRSRFMASIPSFLSSCLTISVTLPSNVTDMIVQFDADCKIIRCRLQGYSMQNTASLNMISHCFLTLIS